MDALWYGSVEGAFFGFPEVSKNRKIKYAMLPARLANKLGNPQSLRIPQKMPGEVRILSADIALMPSKKHNNDATAIFINQLTPTKAGRYVSNFVYTDSYEGLRTDDQALIIRELFDEYMCDYLVLDTNGNGLGVYDALARDMVDSETGEIYPALSCCNNQEMADRCTVVGAPKVIYSVKATAQFNSDCAIRLREAFNNGRVRLLCTEYDADEALASMRGFSSLSPAEKVQIKMPYVNTTLMVGELTKLQYEESSNKIRIKERSNMRKDRYSSLSYNYYVATQLESKLDKRFNSSAHSSDMMIVRPPKYKGKAVSALNGGRKQTSWR